MLVSPGHLLTAKCVTAAQPHLMMWDRASKTLSFPTRSYRQPSCSWCCWRATGCLFARPWLGCRSGWCPLPAHLLQHPCHGPGSQAAVSAHPVHPSQCSWEDGTHHSGVCTGLALGPHRVWECLIYLAHLCSCLYVWHLSQAGHLPSISRVPGVQLCALLVSCTSGAYLSPVFLDSILMQLVRIFKYFDLSFLKYQLSEAHIGLMKQVQFLNWFKWRRERHLVNINWQTFWVRTAEKDMNLGVSQKWDFFFFFFKKKERGCRYCLILFLRSPSWDTVPLIH